MKKLVIITTAIVLALALGLTGHNPEPVSAGSTVEAEKGVIVGYAIDLTTYAMKGSFGEENADSFRNRCELGFPVGIVEEETGKVFVAVFRTPAPASPMATANEIMLPLMGKKVAAQGLLYRGEHLNVIRLSVLSEY